VTEMMACDWSMIIVDVLKYREVFMYLLSFVYLLNIIRHVYFRHQKFSFQTHMERKTNTDNWRLKMENIQSSQSSVAWIVIICSIMALYFTYLFANRSQMTLCRILI